MPEPTAEETPQQQEMVPKARVDEQQAKITQLEQTVEVLNQNLQIAAAQNQQQEAPPADPFEGIIPTDEESGGVVEPAHLRAFGEKLNPWVQEKFYEIWDAAQGGEEEDF